MVLYKTPVAAGSSYSSPHFLYKKAERRQKSAKAWLLEAKPNKIAQIRDGVVTTRDGVETIRDGIETTRNGVETIRDGVVTTRDGVETIRDEIETTRDGIETIRDEICQKKDGFCRN